MKKKGKDEEISRMYLVPHRIYVAVKAYINDENKLKLLDNLNASGNYIEQAIQFHQKKSHHSKHPPPSRNDDDDDDDNNGGGGGNNRRGGEADSGGGGGVIGTLASYIDTFYSTENS